MLLFAELQDAATKQWTRRQIKRPLTFLQGLSLRLPFTLLSTEIAQVCQFHSHHPVLSNHLHGFATFHGKVTVQYFMATHDAVQTTLECLKVELAVESNRDGHVVSSRTGLELIEKP